MARLEKTLQKYQEQLTKKGIKNIPVFVQSILDADMTKGKYSRFLLDCYLNDKFREEDLKGGLESMIGKTISLFHKHKGKLPEEMRSIYRYSSPGGLWNVVNQFDGLLSGQELKRDEQDKIYRETEFVYEDSETGFKVISPLTIESSQWWGRRTRWCTTGEIMFNQYTSQSPLFILLMPGGRKLQLWQGDASVQFMDEADDNVSSNYIKENWDILKPFFVKNYILYFLDKEELDDEYYLSSIKKNPNNYAYLPAHLLTKELINDIPNEILEDSSMMKKIIHKMSLKKIDLDMYKFLDSKISYLFRIMPEYSLDMKIVNFAIEKNGLNLYSVPKHMKNQKICLKAIQQNGLALSSVPLKWQTEQYCEVAFNNNANCIEFIPEKYITERMINECIKQGVPFLKFINYKDRTVQMCKDAVESNDKNIVYIINSNKLNETVINYAEKTDFSTGNLHCIPSFYYDILGQVKTEENISNYEKLPEFIKTKSVSQYAVKNDINNFAFVPYYNQTQKMCDFVVEKDIRFFPKTQKIYRTPELSLYVLSKDISLMKYIPNHIKIECMSEKYNEQFYDILIKNINSNIQNVRFIPKEAYHDEKFHSLLEKINDDNLRNNLIKKYENINSPKNKMFP